MHALHRQTSGRKPRGSLADTKRIRKDMRNGATLGSIAPVTSSTALRRASHDALSESTSTPSQSNTTCVNHAALQGPPVASAPPRALGSPAAVAPQGRSCTDCVATSSGAAAPASPLAVSCREPVARGCGGCVGGTGALPGARGGAAEAGNGRSSSSLERLRANAGVTQAPFGACMPCQHHWPTFALQLHNRHGT